MNECARNTALTVCRLLGDAANRRPIMHRDLPDEEQLRGFSVAHRLTTLVSCALRAGGIPDDHYRTVHAQADVQAFHQIKTDAVAKQLLRQLDDVSPLLLKGPALQPYYPDGWVRTATDIDLFIPAAHLNSAVNTLVNMGFTTSDRHGDQISLQKPPRYHVELHTTLGGFSGGQRRVLGQLTKNRSFSVNDHYVYTLFHLYKHFVQAGAGVRMFFDMYCLSKAVTDRPYVDRLLKDMDLDRFDEAVRCVNGTLFDGNDADDALSDVIDFIFRSTAFGNAEAYLALNTMNRHVTQKSRWGLWLENHGFDRSSMTKRYPVLVKHWWLYPLYSVRRVIHGLFRKRHVLRAAYTAEHAVDRRQLKRILRTVGIL